MEAPSSCKDSAQRIMGARSVHQLYPSKSFILKGPFKGLVLSTSVWNAFNMAAMIVFTPKCPSKGDISHLECTQNISVNLKTDSCHVDQSSYFL